MAGAVGQVAWGSVILDLLCHGEDVKFRTIASLPAMCLRAQGPPQRPSCRLGAEVEQARTNTSVLVPLAPLPHEPAG